MLRLEESERSPFRHGSSSCEPPPVLIRPDIDYFQDLGAHTVLEVIPNSITHGLTDPKKVYVLRWIAGRHAGVPEFAPPYSIAA